MRGQEALKGVARRVVIVRSPPESVFEQAIFIVREDVARSGGVSREEVLNEARRAAGACAGPPGPPPQRWKLWAFLGVSLSALALALVIILI